MCATSVPDRWRSFVLSVDLAVVIAAGDLPRRAALDAAWPGWADGLGLVVAADGGARGARALGLPLEAVVGDGDSLARAEVEALRAEGVEIEAWPNDKDASDLELAVERALRAEPGRLLLLGAFGGPRLDHLLANVWLLGHPALAGCDARAIDGSTRVRLLRGPGRAALEGRPEDLITLLPFGGEAEAVRTEGLRFPLHDEALRGGSSRGLSNVRLSPRAAVTLGAGQLLIIESHPRTASYPQEDEAP